MFADKKEKLAELERHRNKLVTLLGELLAKADDLDQSRQYGRKLSTSQQELLAKTCRDLAELSATVDDIAKLIKAKDVGASRAALLRSTDIAKQLSQRLRQLREN